jgi:hypothetical protein
VRVEVPDPSTETVRVGGLIEVDTCWLVLAESDTVPENCLTLVTVSVTVAEAPLAIVRLVGVEEIVKSPVTVTEIIIEWVRPPPDPATVTE